MLRFIFKAIGHAGTAANHAHKAHRAATVAKAVRAPIIPKTAMWTQGGKIVTRHKIPPGI